MLFVCVNDFLQVNCCLALNGSLTNLGIHLETMMVVVNAHLGYNRLYERFFWVHKLIK